MAGTLLLPVFTIMSAAWFAAMALALLSVWWTSTQAQAGGWPPNAWFDLRDISPWLVVAALLAVYALLALPIGAARRASLYYANGGRLHGWADVWSGLLWLLLVAAVLAVAWQFLPDFQALLQRTLEPGAAGIAA